MSEKLAQLGFFDETAELEECKDVVQNYITLAEVTD